MNNDINLMTQIEKPRVAFSKLFLGTSLLFGLAFATALLLIIHSFALKAQAGSLSENVALARNKIASMISLKQKVLVVSERIDTARNIISKRSNLESRTTQILASIPDNFNIDMITAEKDTVTLVLGSSDLSAFDDLFEVKLTALYRDQALSLKKIESSGFTRTGNYQLTLAFHFSEDIKK